MYSVASIIRGHLYNEDIFIMSQLVKTYTKVPSMYLTDFKISHKSTIIKYIKYTQINIIQY